MVAAGCAIEGSAAATLVAWVDDADPGLRIVDDRGGAYGPEALVDGGRRFRVPIDDDVRVLQMLDAGERSRWTLAIVRRDAPEAQETVPATIDEADALPRPRRARALRAGFAAAHAAGDAVTAQRFAIASHVVALATGEWSTACGVAQAAAFSAQHLGGDAVRAHAWLDLSRWCDARVPEAAPGAAYSRGVVTAAQGRRIEALELLHRAWRGAVRLDLAEAHSFARYYAGVLGEAGFTSAAERMFEGLAAEVPPGCPRAVLELDFAWLLLLRGEAEDAPGTLRRATSLLEHGLVELGEAGACAADLPLLAETFHINLAHGALMLGNSARARVELDAIDPARLDPGLTRWFDRLRAALDLAQGRPQQARAWLDVVAQSQPNDDYDASWRDRVVAARLADALGDSVAALEHDRAAERALDGAVASFAQGLAAGPLLGSRPESSARLVARALEAGDVEVAWCAMRRARRRPLLAAAAATLRLHADDDALAQRLQVHRDRVSELAREIPGADRESLRIRAERRAAMERALATDVAALVPGISDSQNAPCGAPPPTGTLVLAFHPAASGGWTVFANLDGVIETARIDGIPTQYGPAELSARVLAPFTVLVEHADHVRVLPAGPWNAIDLHALPWGDAPLLAALPVSYAMDVAVPTTPARADATISFVDADPLRTLAAHRGPLLAARDRLAGRRRTTWSEPDGIDEVRGALAGSDAWVFFGHAAASQRSEQVPWQASIALVLPGEQRLGAFDVLTAAAGAPRHVALLGCGTGTVDPSLPMGSITLPQALLIRGAQGVVATGHDVAPGAAVAIAEQIVEALPEGPEPMDLAAALRIAQLELRERDPDADWATFRVWEP